MGWKRTLRSYFTFNRRERRGVIALLAILIALIGVQLWLRLAPQDASELAGLDPDRILRSDPAITIVKGDRADSSVSWARFDPNTVTEEQLSSFGLSPRIAKRLVKYRNKGGAFYEPADVLKLYGIDSMWVARAEEYMDFPPKERREEEQTATDEGKEEQWDPVDLNRADTNDLKSIRGIGSYYAREIILLRDRLGGFLSFDQLLDVYNIRDDAITILSENTVIDPTAVKRIDINRCAVDPLGRHPYLSWKQAKVIVSYRQQHGAYARIEDITKTKVVPDSVYRKIAPYLTVE